MAAQPRAAGGGGRGPADVGDELADGHGQDLLHVLLGQEPMRSTAVSVALLEQLGEGDELDALQGQVLVERGLQVTSSSRRSSSPTISTSMAVISARIVRSAVAVRWHGWPPCGCGWRCVGGRAAARSRRRRGAAGQVGDGVAVRRGAARPPGETTAVLRRVRRPRPTRRGRRRSPLPSALAAASLAYQQRGEPQPRPVPPSWRSRLGEPAPRRGRAPIRSGRPGVGDRLDVDADRAPGPGTTGDRHPVLVRERAAAARGERALGPRRRPAPRRCRPASPPGRPALRPVPQPAGVRRPWRRSGPAATAERPAGGPARSPPVRRSPR